MGRYNIRYKGPLSALISTAVQPMDVFDAPWTFLMRRGICLWLASRAKF